MKEQIDMLNRGEAKYQAQDFSGAIKDFSDVIELNAELPIPFFAYFGRGQAKLEIKDCIGAIEDYSEALKLVENAFGFSVHHKKDTGKSMAINKNLIYLKRAVAKTKIKNYLGAIEDYSKAIEFELNSYEPYAGRGEARLGINDNIGAIKDFSKIIEFFSNSYKAFENRGLAKLGLKDYAGALEDFNKAIELNPYNDFTYISRGAVKLLKQSYLGALEDFNKAIELNPHNIDYYDCCIKAYECLNDSEGIRKMQEQKNIYLKEQKRKNI